ncbi:DNA helicase-2/ATP-dependent DNA helicase PcrA [Granulicella aggregans]|uniref:DNA 3'-5' helicase II n=1 Tax=Granulicella aggregans TaxID=474949 RepID=A0A7W8E6K0_9BACT|nr:UvrD-helicase domain-containing protein [Granulicella aggregans]MBB5061293.1 DNA helicase-2/ATP-dependent DNA helicase PcrA [Granulicella aggregans]
MTLKIETAADLAVRECLEKHRSFALIAGAGSGKTSSLVDALESVRQREGRQLRQNGQHVACITFTKRAVEVIKVRLGFDDLYRVSTLHSFLWEQMSRFQSDIREALITRRLPALIVRERAKDNGGNSRAAIDARNKAAQYEKNLEALPTVDHFRYRDAKFGDYAKGQIGHDDIIEIATYLFEANATFRRITGLRFPYIFVDEAQDTFEGIVSGLNLVCAGEGLPLVGYFGDPWQQIYDGSAGSFGPPPEGITVSKTENFRCSESVIRLLNAFREDVQQYAAGDNKGREGSVIFRIVKAEKPDLPRKYSEAQIERALAKMDTAITDWGWNDRNDVVKLFLVRQMIARRMGFVELNRLFNGQFASASAEDAFVAGEHLLLLPLTKTIYPLILAYEVKDSRRIIEILRNDSPAFAIDGVNASRTLKAMIETSLALVDQLATHWKTGTIRDVLNFCVDKQMIRASDKLCQHLHREAREETYDEAIHVLDKGDWLADALLGMNTVELPAYASFITNNTAYSTQHGVKGEEYPKILVVYDDVEANWTNYSFARILTPGTAGEPTDGQRERGRKLAYVSFSRALEDLRVLFFTANPEAARKELLATNLLKADQIQISE